MQSRIITIKPVFAFLFKNSGSLFLAIILVVALLFTSCVKFPSTQKNTKKSGLKPDATANKIVSLIPEQDPDGFLWGLRDTVSSKLIMDYKYQKTWDFQEGYAVVQLNGKFGLIDKKGKEIIPPEYDFPKTNMQCGYIVFEVGYGPVVIFDSTGKSVLPMIYGMNGLLPCQNRISYSNGLLNFAGDTIMPFTFSNLFLIPEGLVIASKRDHTGYNDIYGLYDLNGKELLPHVFQSIDGFYSGRAIVKKDGKYGVLNKAGKELFYTDYGRIDRFQNGYAKVYTNSNLGEVNVGIIDSLGREVVPAIYQWQEYAYNFREGMASMSHDRKYGFLNTNGKVVIPFKYDRVEMFQDGIAKVWIGWKYVGYINKQGDEIIPVTFEAMDQANLRRYFGKYIIGVKDSVYHVFNYSGNKVVVLEYDYLHPFHETKEFFVVAKKGKYGLLDSNFKVKLPLEYESLEYIFEDRIIAFKNGKIGLINLKGEVILPFEYDEIGQFENGYDYGLAQVKKNEKTGLLNSYGKIIIPVIYDEIDYFNHGLAVVKRNGKYGFVNTKGKEVIPVMYDEAWPFNGYTAEVTLNGETFEIDASGNRQEYED